MSKGSISKKKKSDALKTRKENEEEEKGFMILYFLPRIHEFTRPTEP
jgi:hypothetical protein